MLQPARSPMEDRPRATLLRRLGGLALVAGVALNVSMLVQGAEINLRIAMLVMAPGLILLFSAFLAENTPSMKGCLTIFALVLAFVAGFWAWVGVSVALDPEDQPPEMLREAPTNEAEDGEEQEAPVNDAPTDEDTESDEG